MSPERNTPSNTHILIYFRKGGCSLRDKTQHLRCMRCIDEERGPCAAAPQRASRRAHRSASSWYQSGHIPSRYIFHRRDQSALHSSGSTSTTVRIMFPQSPAPRPPLPRRATQGGPMSPRHAEERTAVSSSPLVSGLHVHSGAK